MSIDMKKVISGVRLAGVAAHPDKKAILGKIGRLFMVCVTLAAAVAANDAYAQEKGRSDKRKEAMEAWKKDMAEFRSRSNSDREIESLVDSVASVQASAAVQNMDFVLEADNVSFKNGATAFVNSNTNFIAVKGKRAVVQISPSDFAAGPNGVGGVTVDGMISGMKVKTEKKGRTTISMNVSGIGINAQVELYMFPGSNEATATVYPNFNSNTVWMSGEIIPYENSTVIKGRSL